MKKRELIKKRYDILCKMEKEMNDTCRKCPFSASQTESYSPECLVCPTLKVMKEFGDELTKITLEYRVSNGKSNKGVFIAETGEEVVEAPLKGKKKLEKEFSIGDFKNYRARGLSIEEIAQKYGVSHSCMNNFLHVSGFGSLIKRKDYVNNNSDFMEKNLPIKKVIEMIENGWTITTICKEYDITKNYLDEYIKKGKEELGIKGKIKKKRTTPQIKNAGGFN